MKLLFYLRIILNFLTFGQYVKRFYRKNADKVNTLLEEHVKEKFSVDSVHAITTVGQVNENDHAWISTFWFNSIDGVLEFKEQMTRVSFKDYSYKDIYVHSDENMLVSAYTKAKNLVDRFNKVIASFYVETYTDKENKPSCRYKVKYLLGDELKQFECDFRSNMLKKKLVGAQNHIEKATDKLMSFIGSLNMFYANFKSRLFATVEFFDSPFMAKHFRVCLNEMVLIDTRDYKESPVSSYFLFSSEENETTLKSLVSRDLVKIQIDGKIYLCDAKVKCKERLIICQPIIAERAQSIITTSAILLGSFKGVNSEEHHDH